MSSLLRRLGARAIGKAGIVPRARSLFETSSAVAVAPARETSRRENVPLMSEPATADIVHPCTATQRASDAPSSEPVQTHASGIHDAQESAAADAPQRAPGDFRAQRSESAGLGMRSATAQHVLEGERSGVHVAPPLRSIRNETATPALVVQHPLPVPAVRLAADGNVQARAALSKSQSAEPVHVTIGRVEVRAVFPAPPGRSATRNAPPSLSLGDYLRNRGRP